MYKVRKQGIKLSVIDRYIVDYGYRLGIFTVISHVCVPLLCRQCFYTSTITVSCTILSDCVSVYTLCTNVSTLSTIHSSWYYTHTVLVCIHYVLMFLH